MQELSLLSKKCLVNMPMMLDAITVTIDDMKKLLSSNYEDVRCFIERELGIVGASCFQFDEKFVEQGVISCLEISDNCICPRLAITYNIPFTYSYRKREYAFDAGWEYIANEENNMVRFFLSDASNGCSIWDDVLQDNLITQITDIWQKDKQDGMICMILKMDETFNEEKLLQCFADYKECVLKSFIRYVGDKYGHKSI